MRRVEVRCHPDKLFQKARCYLIQVQDVMSFVVRRYIPSLGQIGILELICVFLCAGFCLSVVSSTPFQTVI